MKKLDQKDLILQAAILGLGQKLTDAVNARMYGQDQEETRPSVIGSESVRVLSLVRPSHFFRSFLGIHKTEKRDDDGIRLRIIAYLSWQAIAEGYGSKEVANVSIASMTPNKQSQNEQLLLARDCIGRMIRSDLLRIKSERRSYIDATISLPLKSYSYLCGGMASLGDFLPHKINKNSEYNKINNDDEEESRNQTAEKIPSAKELFNTVKIKVVGCDPQVKILASRISLAVARAEFIGNGEQDNGIGNQVILVYGSSGTGKTFIVEEIARASNLVFASFDGSGLSGSGWTGSSVDDALKLALDVAKGDPKRASHAIVCIDEIDKVLRGGLHENRQSVQGDLLRPLGGHSVVIGGKRNHDGPPVTFDCGPTIFVLSGVFDGLEELIRKRNKHRSIGFSAAKEEKGIEANFRQALEEYGCIPEICNRISSFVKMPDPSADSIARAIVANEGIVAGFNRVLAIRDIVLFPQPDGVSLLAEYGFESKAFFRGVKHLLGSVVEDLIFNNAQGTVVIDVSMIRQAINRAAGGRAMIEDFDSVDKTEMIFESGSMEEQLQMA